MRLLIINFVVVFFMGASTFTLAQDVKLSIIGNMESVADEMDMDQLKLALRGEKQRWDDGTSIKIALMKTSTPVGKRTCEKIYDMSGNELNKYFLALVFQGKVKAPSFFNSISELESYVSSTPGAIGVSQSSAESINKIIIIDGNKSL